MARKPNILLFLTDDHAPWVLPEYGNRKLQTPHFSRLAREGVLFQNAFTPCPVCSPARACVMTGRTPSQVGIHDWLHQEKPEVAQRDWLAEEATLPQLLRGAGYHTILSGKWHLGHPNETPPGFDRVFSFGAAAGPHNGHHDYHQDGTPVEINGNRSTHITERALTMLMEVPKDRPFFLNVGYMATHSPYAASAHDPSLVKEVEHLGLGDLPTDPPHPWRKNEGMEAGREDDTEMRLSLYRGYHAGVLELDRNVGRILNHLDETEQLDETVVVYVSDHGCALGHQGFYGKGNSTRPLNMYDISLRVPLLIRGPGVPAGKTVEAAVDHYDLFQALCEWGGVDIAPGILKSRCYPGRSLAPLARSESIANWPQNRYGEYGDLRMIRTPEYKFVKRYPNGPHDLFDLIQDPGEKHNQAGDAAFTIVQNRLEAELETWYRRHEDPKKSGLRVKSLPMYNGGEAWRDGLREARGLQIYSEIMP